MPWRAQGQQHAAGNMDPSFGTAWEARFYQVMIVAAGHRHLAGEVGQGRGYFEMNWNQAGPPHGSVFPGSETGVKLPTIGIFVPPHDPEETPGGDKRTPCCSCPLPWWLLTLSHFRPGGSPGPELAGIWNVGQLP